MEFIGREKELAELELLLKKKSSNFVVIRGRRRIGKSRLIREFAHNKNALFFSGLPPSSDTTKQSQIDAFALQMARNLRMPPLKAGSWDELFWHLGHQTREGEAIVVLDEISWIGSKDPDFLGHLKNAWDLYFSHNEKLMLIVCGSVSSWIEANILSHTGFLGRISLDLVVEELPLKDCSKFWSAKKVSAYEKLKVLSVTGGVPKYLEEVIPSSPAEHNIARLCFKSSGLLYREYEQIFSDLFSKRADSYKAIVQQLAKGAMDLDQLSTALSIQKGGKLSESLKDLILAGFVSEDASWNLKDQKVSNLKKFRLKDNYLRFYLKYIEPNREQIAKDIFSPGSINVLPAWESVMGLQFENLVIRNSSLIFDALGVSSADVTLFGPFFQRQTKRQRGCQVDLLIQTRYHTLYVCEIKFSLDPISSRVIEEMETKVTRLSYPKGFSVRPVLIHVNGVSQSVSSANIFDYIIDFSDFIYQT